MSAINFTGNVVGRCPAKGCKHATFIEGAGSIGVGECPAHGRYTLSQVIGVDVPSVKCGARCTNAVGPSCDCSCGGKNHGRGHVA